MGFLSGLFGSQKQSTKSTSDVASWLKPYVNDYLGAAQDQFNKPYEGYSGNTVAQFNPYQTGTINDLYQRGLDGSPVTSSAQGLLTSTLNGDYLSSGNPYLTSQIDKAQGDVVRNYNLAVKPQLDAAQVRSGSFGNTGVAEYQADAQRSLQDTLGNISTQMRGADYGAERNRQMSAIGMAPGLANQDYQDLQQRLNAGGLLQGQEQANLDDSYSRWLQQQGYGQQQLDNFGNAIGRFSGYGTTTNQQTGGGGSIFGQVLGGALGVGSLLGLGRNAQPGGSGTITGGSGFRLL